MNRINNVTKAVAVLAVAGSVTAACSTAPASESGDGASNHLTISWKGSEKIGIEAVLAAYKAKNPKADIILTTADTEQYQATLGTQLSAGTAADVMYIWPANGNPGALLQIAPRGYLLDLSDRPWASKYPDAVKPLMQYEGKTYLMGTLLNTFGVFYNKTALTQTGLTPPATWPEVLPFCSAAKAKGKVAFAMGAATLNNVQNPLYSLGPSLIYGANPNFDKDLAEGKTTFATDPGWKTALDYYQQMIKAGCFNAKSTGLNNDGMLQLVASGKALGTMPSALQLAALRKIAGPDNPIEYHPVSGGNDASTGIIAAASSGGAAVNAKAKNKKMALDFVDFMGTTQGTETFVNAMKGPVPAITDPAIKLAPEALSPVNDYVKAGRTVHFLNQFWPNARTEQAMFAGLQGLLAGSTTPEEVLKGMDAAYNTKK